MVHVDRGGYYSDYRLVREEVTRIVSLPAYLFGCCWVVATLMGNPETSGGMGVLLRFAIIRQAVARAHAAPRGSAAMPPADTV